MSKVTHLLHLRALFEIAGCDARTGTISTRAHCPHACCNALQSPVSWFVG